MNSALSAVVTSASRSERERRKPSISSRKTMQGASLWASEKTAATSLLDSPAPNLQESIQGIALFLMLREREWLQDECRDE